MGHKLRLEATFRGTAFPIMSNEMSNVDASVSDMSDSVSDLWQVRFSLRFH
jgi:hypothetical protein